MDRTIPSISIIVQSEGGQIGGKKAIEKGKVVSRLYFARGFTTKREIASQEEVSLGFASNWIKFSAKDP